MLVGRSLSAPLVSCAEMIGAENGDVELITDEAILAELPVKFMLEHVRQATFQMKFTIAAASEIWGWGK